MAKILDLLSEHLALENELVDILDFVEFKDSYKDFCKKVYKFCEHFKAINENERVKLEEELIKIEDFSPSKFTFYRNYSKNLLHM